MRKFCNFPSVRSPAYWLGLLFLFLFVPNLARAQKATRVGDEACMQCHEEVASAFATNLHMRSAPQPGATCESCHGPGSLHAEESDPALIYNPARDYNAAEANPCLTCHNGDKFASAAGQAHHEVADGCSDCHVIHSGKKHYLKKTGSALCLDCHRDVGSQFRLTSHHPVPEGLMTCESCHNVHGGKSDFALTNGNRERCISCHADKEGPFVYEHQPVNEDCGICHSAHGTVADNLLVQNEPALCLGCHSMHFHTGLTGFAGNFTSPLDPGRGGFSTRDGFKKAMLTKCTQCHVAIHGSDLPSQTISGQGKALTR